MVVSLTVRDDTPEVDAHLLHEAGQLASTTEHAQKVELLNAELQSWCLSDLVKQILNLWLLKVEVAVVEDLVHLLLVVALGQVPKLGQQLLRHEVLLEEAAEDIS